MQVGSTLAHIYMYTYIIYRHAGGQYIRGIQTHTHTHTHTVLPELRICMPVCVCIYAIQYVYVCTYNII